MKNIHSIILTSLLVVTFSCQKEMPKIASEQPPIGYQQSKSMFGSMEQIDFMNDFIISADEMGNPRNIRPSDQEWALQTKASSQDISELQKSFPSVKKNLDLLIKENQNDQYTSTIQFVSLNYLRKLILLKDTPKHRKLAKELMEVLLNTKAIDLDVLVDTYIFIQNDLSKVQQERYFNYLEYLYVNDLNQVKNTWKDQEKAYKTADGDAKKIYLLNGKKLERQSKACAYARAKLPEIVRGNH